MADIKTTLGKKVGPLPLGAWLIIVGGAGAYYMYLKRSAEPTYQEPMEDTGTPAGVGNGALIQSDYQTTTGSTNSSVSFETNDQWGQAVINYLIARGIAPTVAQNAVSKYLNSESLSTSEWAILNIGIGYAGAPPILPASSGDAPNTPNVNPPTPTTPSTAFKPGWYHTIKNGVAGRATSAETSASKKVVNSGTNLYIVAQDKARSQATDGLWYFTRALAPGQYVGRNAKRAVSYTVPSTSKTIASIAKMFKISATSLYNANKSTLNKQKVNGPNDKTKVKKGTKLSVPAT